MGWLVLRCGSGGARQLACARGDELAARRGVVGDLIGVRRQRRRTLGAAEDGWAAGLPSVVARPSAAHGESQLLGRTEQRELAR